MHDEGANKQRVAAGSPLGLVVDSAGHEVRMAGNVHDGEVVGDKSYAVFRLCVTSSRASWIITHRYSEFRALADKLGRAYTCLPLLPRKSMQLRSAQLSESFVTERGAALVQWLNLLLSRIDVGTSAMLGLFLNIPANHFNRLAFTRTTLDISIPDTWNKTDEDNGKPVTVYIIRVRCEHGDGSTPREWTEQV